MKCNTPAEPIGGSWLASVEWRSIPTVLYPQEILDKAFGRASSQANLVEDPDKYHRVRKQMNRMVQSACDVATKTLNSYVDRWPSLNALSEFDQALVDAAVGCDDYKRNLAALQWAAEKSQRISGEAQSKILRLRDIDGFHQARRHAYGRLSSIIDQISSQILWLGDARDVLRTLPSIDPTEPCIVVAGSPNVGKSALIGALSSGEPQVASYPFTTKQLHLGHFSHRRRVYQMVDTPGLLDRPMPERNHIEMQAIAALEHLGDVLLFLIDRTDESTTTISEQERLLDEVRNLLSDRRVLVVSTKSDILVSKTQQDDHQISSITGQGLEELRSDLIGIIDADKIEDPLSLPDHWPREEKS